MTMPSTSASAALDSFKVLLVCREEKTISLLADILIRAGHPVLTAQSPEDAWECIRTGTVVQVVLDLTAPTPDHVMFVRAARSSSLTSDLPFLFITRSGYKPPILLPFGDESARDGYLPVPCPSHQFLSMVRRILDQHAQQRARLLQSALAAPNQQPAGSAGAFPALATAAVEPPAGKATMVPAPTEPPGLFAGQLGAIDVTKILSMLEPLRLTGILTLGDEKREGKVYFVEGAAWHAELSDIQGPDALFLLFHMREGAFRFDAAPPTPQRTILENTMGLLLEGLRQMDEAKTIIKRLKDRRDALTNQAPHSGKA